MELWDGQVHAPFAQLPSLPCPVYPALLSGILTSAGPVTLCHVLHVSSSTCLVMCKCEDHAAHLPVAPAPCYSLRPATPLGAPSHACLPHTLAHLRTRACACSSSSRGWSPHSPRHVLGREPPHYARPPAQPFIPAPRLQGSGAWIQQASVLCEEVGGCVESQSHIPLVAWASTWGKGASGSRALCPAEWR